MPRRDRYAPRFDERLRQSRVARGLEQAPPAPEPRVEHRIATDWGQIIAGDLVDTTLRDYWEAIGRLQQEAYARMYGTPAQLIVDPGSITGRITPRPDRYAHVPVATPVEPPQRKEPQSMNQQTEQTVITVLQQAVADAIYFIQRIKERCIEYGVKPRVHELYTGSNRSDYSHPGYAFYNHGHLRIDHDSPLNLSDAWRQVVFLDCYNHRTTLSVPAVVLRHVAVLNAVDDLMKTRRAYTPAEREAFLVDARSRQITDFEEYFAGHGDIFGISACPVQPSSMSATYIQQLNLPGNYIHHIDNALHHDNLVSFGPTTPLWRVREALRMKHGEYTALPNEVLALLPQEVIDTQFPHVATKAGNAGMIAYTQSPVAGMLDRQQVIKPGRYIRQHCEDLTDEQVKQAAASCVAASAAGFHHSKDADDFARIYINGPSSCMAYDETGKEFGRLMVNGEFFHPARVYAHPDNDIEIVWLEVAGRIGARAVINTANKTYPRIYGSDSVRGGYNRLAEYLEALGYRQMDGALNGQKLLKVHPDRFPNAIICPYIDSGNLGVDIFDDHLVAGGNYDADHETGCLNRYNTSDWDEYTWQCDCCGDDQTDDDSQYDTNDGHVCEGCASRHYTQVFDIESNCTRYVNDNETFYNGRYTIHGRFYTLWFNGSPDDYGYVELCSHYYGDNFVAPQDECIEDMDGDWVRRADVEDHGLFINEDEDIAYRISGWAVLDGELIEIGDIPNDTERLVEADDVYPMLPVYRTLEQEDAA